MSKIYKFYYAADVITVVASGALKPLKPSQVTFLIDEFENSVTELTDKLISEGKDEYEYDVMSHLNTILTPYQTLLIAQNNTPNPDPPPAPPAPPAPPGPQPPGPSPGPSPSPDPYDPSKVVVYGPAWIYGGARFETTFLSIGTRYKDLGLLREEDLKTLQNKVTKRRYRTFSSLASNEIMSEVTFKIKPADPSKFCDPYGQLYETSVPYATRFLFSKIRSVVENWTFNFGPDKVKYVVVQGSVKQRRLRKWNPM